ncbi:MAG: hypothetical protein IJU59_04655 [Firmicutes bacterium]|nr:hypothetical protein [Bacillota bacterium]
MRVTSKMMQRTYLKNVNSLTSGTQNSLNQLSSGMKLFKASENTAAAVKAYQVRTSLNRNEGYSSNLSHADAVLTSSESVLLGVEDRLKEAKAKITQALNTTNSENERATIASELASIQDQIFQAMNSNDSGFYVFGGSNTNSKPFGTDANGQLTYNGETLSTLANDPLDPTVHALSHDALYLDVGLAPELDADENVISSTVFEYSITGIDVMGYGRTVVTPGSASVTAGSVTVSGDYTGLDDAVYTYKTVANDGVAADGWYKGTDTEPTDLSELGLIVTGTPASGDTIDATAGDVVSSNLYDVLGELVKEFTKSDDAGSASYSVDRAEKLLAVFDTAVATVTTQLTNIGAKTSYIEYSENRISTLDINLNQKQADIEDVNYAEAFTTFSSLYTSYQAALNIGSKIIGPSLFDYMR